MSAEIWQALAKAQARMQSPNLDKTNTRFNTRYASLQSLLSAIRGPLNEQGLFFWNEVVQEDGMPWMVTKVTNGIDTVSIGKVEHVPGGDSQKVGSALTYSKRQSLSAAFALAGEEDDDANAAVDVQPNQRGKQPAKQQRQQPVYQQPYQQYQQQPQQYQQPVAQTPYQVMVNHFHARCDELGFDKNEMWGAMLNDLGIEISETAPKPNIDAAMGWINRMS